jgi:hypothetical protein
MARAIRQIILKAAVALLRLFSAKPAVGWRRSTRRADQLTGR